MGGDVGALLSAPGWLFIGLPHEVQVIVVFPSNCIDIPWEDVLQPKCPWFCFSQDLHDGLLKLSSLLLLVFQHDQGSPGNCVLSVLFVSYFGFCGCRHGTCRHQLNRAWVGQRAKFMPWLSVKMVCFLQEPRYLVLCNQTTLQFFFCFLFSLLFRVGFSSLPFAYMLSDLKPCYWVFSQSYSACLQ